jgi:mannose-6-phosphate isomerase-like protein (cupin superfamily)
MDTNASFALSGMRVHLPEGPSLRPLLADAAFWSRLATDHELRSGRLLGVHAVRTDEDVHAAQWEMHPSGDEFLCLCSGRIDLVLDEAGGPRVVALEPMTGIVVPRGTWHRLLVVEPSVLVALTRHEDTQLRAVHQAPPPVSASEWQREVFPHSPLEALAPDLWVVRGEFPSSQLPRNMVVYRYGGDSLLLHSVVALDERTMRHLEALGKPSLMVIPNWDHWAHIVAFKKRYPAITVVCPQASRSRVEQRLAVDQTCEAYFPRHGVRFHVPPGMDPVEGVLELPLGDGQVALVMNDLITTVPHQPGLWGLVLRLTGSTGRPRVIPIVRRRLKIDRAVVRGYLEALARRREVAIITTSHGQALTSEVAAVVGAVARIWTRAWLGAVAGRGSMLTCRRRTTQR